MQPPYTFWRRKMKLENKMDLLLENRVSIFVHIHFHSWMYIRQFVGSNSEYVKAKIRNWKINRWRIRLSTLKCATHGRFAISSLFKRFSLRLQEKNKSKQNKTRIDCFFYLSKKIASRMAAGTRFGFTIGNDIFFWKSIALTDSFNNMMNNLSIRFMRMRMHTCGFTLHISIC